MTGNEVTDDYSDEQLDEILTQVDRWREDFFQSDHFETLTETHQVEAEFIVMTFAELMYGY
jgi:hypothetical protein